jgi:hypothetical protein
MQYGVYVDFFDSVDIVCMADRCRSFSKKTKYFSNVWLPEKDFNSSINHFNSLPEARAKAIEKADEIFNNLN